MERKEELPQGLPAVYVEWLDSTQPGGGWLWAEDVAERVAVCHSVGWLIQEDDLQLTVALSRSTDASGNTQVSGVAAIPRAAIQRVQRLTSSLACSEPASVPSRPAS